MIIFITYPEAYPGTHSFPFCWRVSSPFQRKPLGCISLLFSSANDTTNLGFISQKKSGTDTRLHWMNLQKPCDMSLTGMKVSGAPRRARETPLLQRSLNTKGVVFRFRPKKQVLPRTVLASLRVLVLAWIKIHEQKLFDCSLNLGSTWLCKISSIWARNSFSCTGWSKMKHFHFGKKMPDTLPGYVGIFNFGILT